MTTYKVLYSTAESRYGSDVIDYMLATIDDPYEDIELYAECPIGSTEDATYEQLKSEILSQAREAGIPADCLRFWFD